MIVESDVQTLVPAINNLCQRRGNTNTIVEEDIRLLKSKFDSINFSFCFRECNEIAHKLDAKWTTSSFCDKVLLEGGPTWIIDLIVSDSRIFLLNNI